MTYIKSATIERARAVVKQLHDRNRSTWDDLDRETVHAINALVSYAEFLRHRPMQPYPDNFIDALKYDVALRDYASSRCQCPECQIKPHASDCAVHSEPAHPKGECDCGMREVE